MTAGPYAAAPGAPEKRLVQRLVYATAALAVVGLALVAIAWFFSAGAAPPPTRAPFGMGLREAAPPPSGFGAMILGLQSQFYRSLQGALAAIDRDGAAFWSLLGIGFAYGVFHAAGPGHGKAVIAAYLVASERALAKGFALSLAAALLQALVAIGLVVTLTLALKATAATMSRVTDGVELASFAAIALLGMVLTWRKAGKLAGIVALARDPAVFVADTSCDHVHLPPPEAIERLTAVRDMATVVLAAGLRPCAGAVIVLVFASSQNLLFAGIAATFAMALGTALTTGLIATLAVFAKAFALRLAGGRGHGGAAAIAGLELLAAAAVALLGATLLAGYGAGAA